MVLSPLLNSNLLNLTSYKASSILDPGQEVNRTRNRSRCRDHAQKKKKKKKTAANLSVSGNSLQIWNVEDIIWESVT